MSLEISKSIRRLEPRIAVLLYSGGVVGMLGGMLLDSELLVVLSAVVCMLADVPSMMRPITKRSQLRDLVTIVTRQVGRGALLVTVLVAITGTHGRGVIIAALAAVLVTAAAHFGYRVLHSARVRRESGPFLWRNLEVRHGAIRSAEPSGRLEVGALGFLVAELTYIGALVLLDRDGVTATMVVLALAAVLAVATTGLAFLAWHSSPTSAESQAANAALREALRSFAPEAVFYFSSPPSGSYALTVWTEIVNAIRVPTVVILRESVHLSALDRIRVPIVVLPTATDVESFHLESMRVVLYPTNVIQNNHMVRLPGLRHCFIGHGDSDKAGSFSPVSRMYDEIWVAGQAAVDRYRAAAEGFIFDRIRIVGRPQLANIRRGPRRTAGDRLTVLYAPTWEGFFDPSDYSSLKPMGLELVSALMERGARVLFKPHPATGERLTDARRISNEIASLLGSAGQGHHVVQPAPDALYDAFNTADVVITDVSSVITDFLASRKPLIVTNPKRFALARFHTMFPSAKAAYVLDRPSQLGAVLDDLVGTDPLRQVREQQAMYLLGEHREDPFRYFLDEVDRFLGRANQELEQRERARASFEGSTPWLAQ
jgi:hypothetical protein